VFGKKIGPMPSFTHEIGSLDQSDRRLIFPVILFPVRAQTIQHQREREGGRVTLSQHRQSDRPDFCQFSNDAGMMIDCVSSQGYSFPSTCTLCAVAEIL